MASILRKNNKKIMAILGVFLMIAFGWPTFRGKNAARSGSEVIGRIGSDTIYNVEYQNVRGGDPVMREQAITHWQTIMSAFDRIASAPKVTPAESLRFLARQQQEISLQLVEFRAEDFMRDIPEPTKAQMEEFFSKYRND